jgi:acetyltransferase-like isoleucine patch superfamily enzyme
LFNLASGSITIEEEVFFCHNVSLLTGTHDISKTGSERKISVPRQWRDIVIRKGVWIASNATIIGPCEIGENSVIGACSLVIGDVLPNCLYAGIPAKLVRHIEIEKPTYANTE